MACTLERALLCSLVLFAQLACSSSELDWGDGVPSRGATSGSGGMTDGGVTAASGAHGGGASGNGGSVGLGGNGSGGDGGLGNDAGTSTGGASPNGGAASHGGATAQGGAAHAGDGTVGGMSPGDDHDPYRRCDPNSDDSGGCDVAARCMRNTCAPACRGGELPSPPEDCPQPVGGTARRFCASGGSCELLCSGQQTCPDGMVCDSNRICAWL